MESELLKKLGNVADVKEDLDYDPRRHYEEEVYYEKKEVKVCDRLFTFTAYVGFRKKGGYDLVATVYLDVRTPDQQTAGTGLYLWTEDSLKVRDEFRRLFTETMQKKLERAEGDKYMRDGMEKFGNDLTKNIKDWMAKDIKAGLK